MEFKDLIKQLRMDKKYSTRQLESYSGISQAYISQIENGKKGIPSPEIIKKLSEALEVNYTYLMKEAGHLEDEKDLFNDPLMVKFINEFKNASNDIKRDVLDYLMFKKQRQ